MAERAFKDWPLVSITMNPIKGPRMDYYAFCDFAAVRQDPSGAQDQMGSRVRCLDRMGELNCIGDFTDKEAIRFKLQGWEYIEQARNVGDVIDDLGFLAVGCVPVAVNAWICRRLLHEAVRKSEREGYHFDKNGVYAIRTKSRWIDLGLWRRAALDRGLSPEPFSGLKLDPIPRAQEALRLLPPLAEMLRIGADWPLSRVLDWQDTLPPF